VKGGAGGSPTVPGAPGVSGANPERIDRTSGYRGLGDPRVQRRKRTYRRTRGTSSGHRGCRLGPQRTANLFRISARDTATALGAESAFVFAPGYACREMIAKLTFGQFECCGREYNCRGVRATGDVLTVATVALDHHQWLCGALITNVSTITTAGDR
jgi:hypothetical protein